MKLVSWMACWRRCSPALLSGEREDHGKQVLTHKQNMQMFQSVMSYLIYRFLVPFAHILWYACHTETGGAYERLICSMSLVLSVSMFLSTNNNRFVCVPCVSVPSVAWLRDCGLWLYGYRGAKPIPPMAGTTTKEEGGCQGEGVGSKTLKRGTTGEGVVVE